MALPEHVLESAGLALLHRAGPRAAPRAAPYGRRDRPPAADPARRSPRRASRSAGRSARGAPRRGRRATPRSPPTVADDAEAIEDVVATSARAERLHALLGNLARAARHPGRPASGSTARSRNPLEVVAAGRHQPRAGPPAAGACRVTSSTRRSPRPLTEDSGRGDLVRPRAPGMVAGSRRVSSTSSATSANGEEAHGDHRGPASLCSPWSSATVSTPAQTPDGSAADRRRSRKRRGRRARGSR